MRFNAPRRIFPRCALAAALVAAGAARAGAFASRLLLAFSGEMGEEGTMELKRSAVRSPS
jgi:hypothetical protein